MFEKYYLPFCIYFTRFNKRFKAFSSDGLRIARQHNLDVPIRVVFQWNVKKTIFDSTYAVIHNIYKLYFLRIYDFIPFNAHIV